MTGNDTDSTVYTVAYRDGRFLMVWNRKRGGWEMPGGHIKEGETVEQGAAREFAEEAGYSIEILKTRDLGQCFVCAALLGERCSETPEMKVQMFDMIPDELFFSHEEYDDVVPWAGKIVAEYSQQHYSKKRAKENE